MCGVHRLVCHTHHEDVEFVSTTPRRWKRAMPPCYATGAARTTARSSSDTQSHQVYRASHRDQVRGGWAIGGGCCFSGKGSSRVPSGSEAKGVNLRHSPRENALEKPPTRRCCTGSTFCKGFHGQRGKASRLQKLLPKPCLHRVLYSIGGLPFLGNTLYLENWPLLLLYCDRPHQINVRGTPNTA